MPEYGGEVGVLEAGGSNGTEYQWTSGALAAFGVGVGAAPVAVPGWSMRRVHMWEPGVEYSVWVVVVGGLVSLTVLGWVIWEAGSVSTSVWGAATTVGASIKRFATIGLQQQVEKSADPSTLWGLVRGHPGMAIVTGAVIWLSVVWLLTFLELMTWDTAAVGGGISEDGRGSVGSALAGARLCRVLLLVVCGAVLVAELRQASWLVASVRALGFAAVSCLWAGIASTAVDGLGESLTDDWVHGVSAVVGWGAACVWAYWAVYILVLVGLQRRVDRK